MRFEVPRPQASLLIVGDIMVKLDLYMRNALGFGVRESKNLEKGCIMLCNWRL